MDRKLVKQFKRGPYVIKHELVDQTEYGGKGDLLMKSAYSLEGDYIGTTRNAHHFWKRYGITKFEKTEPDNCVCSIGFSPRQKKWYGWSHRAIFGYRVGHVVKEGDLTATSGWTEEYLKTHTDDKPMPVGFKVMNLKDAKRCAIAFAASVS